MWDPAILRLVEERMENFERPGGQVDTDDVHVFQVDRCCSCACLCCCCHRGRVLGEFRPCGDVVPVGRDIDFKHVLNVDLDEQLARDRVDDLDS